MGISASIPRVFPLAPRGNIYTSRRLAEIQAWVGPTRTLRDGGAADAVRPGDCGHVCGGQRATTVATVTALQQFMSITPSGTPAWAIGAPSANVTGMANAFTQVGNLVSIATGASAQTSAAATINSVTYTTTITPDSAKI